MSPQNELRPEAAEEDEELTVQHEPRAGLKSMLSWAKAPQQHSSGNGSVLKLLGLGAVGLLFTIVVLFALTRSASTSSPEPAPQQATEQVQPNPNPEPARQDTVAKSSESPTPKTGKPEDEELKRLREKRLTAKPSERTEILQSFAKVEKRYPNDYRFPYERAKFAVKGRKTTNANSEAFVALSRAAQRAISTGKAREMLANLEDDKTDEFQSLARGRREWAQLQEALKNRDVRVLNTRQGLD